MTSLEQARKIVQVMDSKKAKDIRLIKIERDFQSGRLLCGCLCQ